MKLQNIKERSKKRIIERTDNYKEIAVRLVSDFSIVTEAEKQQNDICNVLRKIYHLLLSQDAQIFTSLQLGWSLKLMLIHIWIG